MAFGQMVYELWLYKVGHQNLLLSKISGLDLRNVFVWLC
jgi:hypothetical protein